MTTSLREEEMRFHSLKEGQLFKFDSDSPVSIKLKGYGYRQGDFCFSIGKDNPTVIVLDSKTAQIPRQIKSQTVKNRSID